jgi:UDP-3-O-[3-hydroxymyristoyl] glucosamine N-acyltransferase
LAYGPKCIVDGSSGMDGGWELVHECIIDGSSGTNGGCELIYGRLRCIVDGSNRMCKK